MLFSFLRRNTLPTSTAGEAHAAMRRGAVLLDVREPHEWRSGHAAGARHHALGRLRDERPKVTTTTEIHVICASGHRSRLGARLLQRAGFETVYSVRGGMGAWRAAGLPVDR